MADCGLLLSLKLFIKFSYILIFLHLEKFKKASKLFKTKHQKEINGSHTTNINIWVRIHLKYIWVYSIPFKENY